jgi:hypothetical protein
MYADAGLLAPSHGREQVRIRRNMQRWRQYAVTGHLMVEILANCMYSSQKFAHPATGHPLRTHLALRRGQ